MYLNFVSEVLELAYLVFDLFAPVCIHHGIARLLVGAGGGADMGDHDGLAVPPEGFLEDPGQLGVTVVDVVAVVTAQGVDAVGKSQERAIDVSTFYHSLAPILKYSTK